MMGVCYEYLRIYYLFFYTVILILEAAFFCLTWMEEITRSAKTARSCSLKTDI